MPMIQCTDEQAYLMELCLERDGRCECPEVESTGKQFLAEKKIRMKLG